MGYSTVIDPALKRRVQIEKKLIDGGSVIQEAGYTEVKTIRFFWITQSELDTEISNYEAESSDGWVIDNITRTPIQPPLDLYNVTIQMHRTISS